MNDPFHAFVPYPPVRVAHGAGPLDGLTLAVKDIFDVAGYRTGCGNPIKLAESPVAAAHATVVARLLDAGARFAGKAQTEDLAWSIIGRNPHFGPPVNPAAPDRIPGGSSSGSAAAVAGGLADIALGSDTGGSVRAPAAFCGTWGLRPTWGRASLAGCMPLAQSFDTPGLFAMDGATLHRAAATVFGPDAAPLGDGLRVAADVMDLLRPAVRPALDAAVAAIGPDGATALLVDTPARIYACFDAIQGREVVANHGDWIARRQVPLHDLIRDRYAAALAVTEADEAAARRLREDLTAALLERIGGQAVLAPVVHDVPPLAAALVAEQLAWGIDARALLSIAAVGGLPQVVFPAGRVDGVPVALSLIGPPGTDLALVARAAALAAVTA